MPAVSRTSAVRSMVLAVPKNACTGVISRETEPGTGPLSPQPRSGAPVARSAAQARSEREPNRPRPMDAVSIVRVLVLVLVVVVVMVIVFSPDPEAAAQHE